jgi:hypothetical protein
MLRTAPPAAEELEIDAVGAAARLRFLGAGELECENNNHVKP